MKKKENKRQWRPAESTLRGLSAPNLTQQPLCITYLEMTGNFNLKTGFIHLLPAFYAHVGENPDKLMKEFHIMCYGIRPHGVTKK